MEVNRMIERVYDKNKITEVVTPMICDVVEDGTSHDCFELDVFGDCWLSCDDYSAVFHVKAFNRTTLDLHCYIPKKNRSKCIAYGREALLWIRAEAPSMYKKVITQVPSIYGHVGKYVLRMGFTKEGSYTDSFLKDKKLWNLDLFGLNRVDICQL